MNLPRLLTIMGSGETAPTMVKVHRTLVERVGGGPCVLLDTPYGFQENADELSARTQAYFTASVGHHIEVASWRSEAVGELAEAAALGRIEAATYVFAGPGSPSYALGVWRSTPLAALLTTKLEHGGAVTFASAAALTLGLVTLPVYEIYKVGQPPHWLEGLDVLGAATGLRAAVIPHFDNTEGTNHDTRFCYLGERRLGHLLAELPTDAFVLGIDEHTALVLDLDAGRASVVGLGQVTVRTSERTAVWAAGSELAIAELDAAASGAGSIGDHRPDPGVPGPPPAPAPRTSPLLAETGRLEQAFHDALGGRDVPAAVTAVLELDRLLAAWAADATQSDEPDRARVVLRSMIVRLGDLAATGARDQAVVLAPYVDAVLAARAAARAGGNWELSDDLRRRLADAGVEVRDTATGQSWQLSDVPGGITGSGC